MALEAENIEARPVWKPMHFGSPLGVVFAAPARLPETVGGAVAADLFERGLCLPSGSNLTEEQLARVVAVVRGMHSRSTGQPDRVSSNPGKGQAGIS